MIAMRIRTEMQPHFQNRYLRFLTSAYKPAAYYHFYNTGGVPAHENSGVAVKISFLANV